MSTLQSDAAVVLGRFRGPHLGHIQLIEEALARADKVIIGVGSSFQARNSRNPFVFDEVREMLNLAFSEAERQRLRYVPLRDFYDDERWKAETIRAIEAAAGTTDLQLVGCFKDASSASVSEFPWKLHAVTPRWPDLHATTVRQVLLGGEGPESVGAVLAPYVHPAIIGYLKAWMRTPACAAMVAETRAVQAYRQKYGAGPFVSTDAAVFCQDKLLVIQRGGVIGHGLLALPGGFLEADEELLAGALRELREETRFPLPDWTMRRALRGVRSFSHATRSQRARIITFAHHFELGDIEEPQVQAADDALHSNGRNSARFVSEQEMHDREAEWFEDHFVMAQAFFDARRAFQAG